MPTSPRGKVSGLNCRGISTHIAKDPTTQAVLEKGLFTSKKKKKALMVSNIYFVLCLSQSLRIEQVKVQNGQGHYLKISELPCRTVLFQRLKRPEVQLRMEIIGRQIFSQYIKLCIATAVIPWNGPELLNSFLTDSHLSGMLFKKISIWSKKIVITIINHLLTAYHEQGTC